jgi:hypothetical protein
VSLSISAAANHTLEARRIYNGKCDFLPHATPLKHTLDADKCKSNRKFIMAIVKPHEEKMRNRRVENCDLNI